AEVMRSPHLEGHAVAHQALEGQRVDRAGESLRGRFLAGQNWDREPVLSDRAVIAEDQRDLVHGLLREGVEGVPLLPPELPTPQEQPRAHLPPDDAVPLVGQLGQVAMALDVALDEWPDDRLRRGPHREWLLELLHPTPGARDP